tara:strand:- start:126 stop:278 length:153 start_codon:yes stop_codon:yes gene_type:complete
LHGVALNPCESRRCAYDGDLMGHLLADNDDLDVSCGGEIVITKGKWKSTL